MGRVERKECQIRKIALFGALLMTVSEPSFAQENSATVPPDKAAELQRQIDLLGQEVQKLKIGDAAAEVTANRQDYGFGPAMSKVYRVQQGLSLGGYGEILYENFRSGFDSPGKRIAPGEDFSTSDGKARFDITRAVLYVGYKFSDSWVLNSELEFEHGGAEIAVEFLYLDYFWKPAANFRFGSMLMPMGLTNETHEPTTFLGTHRPLVETLIIPSTWSQYGAGIFGSAGPLTYRSYLVTGLNASGYDAANGIREGRYENGFANASSIGWVARADYTGSPGLLAGLSFFVGDASTNPASGFNLITVPTRVAEAHVQWNWQGLSLRALGAYSTFSNIDQLNARNGVSTANSVGSRQGGVYLEAGYDLLAGSQHSLTPYFRWETLSTQLEVPPGYTISGSNLVRQAIVGINYKPLQQIVFKTDYQWNILGDSSGVDQFNVAMGYVF